MSAGTPEELFDGVRREKETWITEEGTEGGREGGGNPSVPRRPSTNKRSVLESSSNLHGRNLVRQKKGEPVVRQVSRLLDPRGK